MIDLSDTLEVTKENKPPTLTEIISRIEVKPYELNPKQQQTNSSATKCDIARKEERKSWDKTELARCNFDFRLNITRRSNLNFVSIWKKTVTGRTLQDIKADEGEVEHFAQSIVPIIKDTLGDNLREGNYCICTTPKRRHKEKNFATLISERIGELLGIPFYEDVATCRSRHRVGAVFDLNNLPKERNIIVFDDFVTTGQTLLSMKNLLTQYKKNLTFFTGVDNKI